MMYARADGNIICHHLSAVMTNGPIPWLSVVYVIGLICYPTVNWFRHMIFCVIDYLHHILNRIDQGDPIQFDRKQKPSIFCVAQRRKEKIGLNCFEFTRFSISINLNWFVSQRMKRFTVNLYSQWNVNHFNDLLQRNRLFQWPLTNAKFWE